MREGRRARCGILSINYPTRRWRIPDLTEPEKDIVKALRGGVPPQPTLLADHLMRWVQEDVEARRELEDSGSTMTAFPATVRLWRGFRERLGRQVEGVRRPVRRQLLSAGSDLPEVVDSLRKVEAIAGLKNSVIAPIVQRLQASEGKADLIEEVVAAISNKETRQLNQEDYGRASGILEVLQSLAPPKGRMTVVLPDGGRRRIARLLTRAGVFADSQGDPGVAGRLLAVSRADGRPPLGRRVL